VDQRTAELTSSPDLSQREPLDLKGVAHPTTVFEVAVGPKAAGTSEA
jgi:hypothetical protein